MLTKIPKDILDKYYARERGREVEEEKEVRIIGDDD